MYNKIFALAALLMVVCLSCRRPDTPKEEPYPRITDILPAYQGSYKSLTNMPIQFNIEDKYAIKQVHITISRADNVDSVYYSKALEVNALTYNYTDSLRLPSIKDSTVLCLTRITISHVNKTADNMVFRNFYITAPYN